MTLVKMYVQTNECTYEINILFTYTHHNHPVHFINPQSKGSNYYCMPLLQYVILYSYSPAIICYNKILEPTIKTTLQKKGVSKLQS